MGLGGSRAVLPRALKSTKKLALELPVFGGFFSGAKYNFVVCGQENTGDSDSVETVRVIKYDKSWNRKGAKSYFGINTHIPFDAGTVSMTEDDERLYIHTCHEMYTTSDGYNHQANMTFFLNKETMESVYANYTVMNVNQTGYVSHSFNQVIRTDGEYVYTADHGDANPRSVVIVKRRLSGSPVKNADALAIKGDTGNNLTKATLGDMQLSDANVITVGASVPQDADFDSHTQKNIYVSALSKSALSSQSFVWLTDYGDDADVTVCNPYLVRTGSNSFTVVWEELSGSGNSIRFARIDGSIRLDEAFDAICTQRTCFCTYDTSGHCVVQSQWVTDSQHPLTDLHVVRVGNDDGGQVLCVNLDECQVGSLVGPDDAG